MSRNEQIEIDLTGLPDITIPKFYPLYWADELFLVMKGGAGSGKSHFAAQKIVYKCLEEDGHHVLVVRNTATSIRKSCFPLIVDTIKTFLGDDWKQIVKVNETEMKIVFANGSTIWFAGCDDTDKLKSIYNVSIIWIEEAAELDVKDFRLLKTRLRYKKPGLMQMIITFNPVSITSWLKSEFFDDQKSNVCISESTYHDNPFLPQEYIDEMESFKQSDPYYYQVYVCNFWGVVGRTVFDMARVAERYKYLTQQRADGQYAYRQGMFTYETYEDKAGNTRVKYDSIEFVDTSEGFIKLLREPVEGRYYTIGGDTAGSEVGADDKDFFAGQVIDSTTKEQMAIFHEDRIEDDEFGFQMYCLGTYYNEALIAIETNFSLVPTNLLAELNYSNLYMRETVDTSTHRVQKKYGVRTDKRTRPLMIAEAIKLVRDNVEQINDIGTLEEMMVFVRNDKGRAEAQNGKHDDLVMSLCISLYANSQQDKIRALSEPEKKTEIQKHKEKMMKKVNSKHNKFARY